MGAFYGNITLKGPSQADVAKAMRGRRAIVTPKVGDYTVAFDSVCDEQDVDGIQALTSQLSRELRCPALAVIVHDDDVLGYFLYRDGELADWYNSSPSYFDFGSMEEPAGPEGGSADQLCEAFGQAARKRWRPFFASGPARVAMFSRPRDTEIWCLRCLCQDAPWAQRLRVLTVASIQMAFQRI